MKTIIIDGVEYNLTPKVVFHKGDWIVHHGTENVYQVVAVIDTQYQLKYGDNYTIQNCVDVDRCARLWDVAKDAKDGDVLATKAGGIFIYKELLYDKPFAYCGVDKFGVFKDCNCGGGLDWTPYLSDVTPATKEQHDTLMKAMADAGWEFDFEKKELKKIGQKPAEWSEEDKCILLSIKCVIDNVWHSTSDIDTGYSIEELKEMWEWLDEIWRRVKYPAYEEKLDKKDDTTIAIENEEAYKIGFSDGKAHAKEEMTSAWSEEDEMITLSIEQVINCASLLNIVPEKIDKIRSWLKSLKDRVGCEANFTTTWKPSDEQIEALEHFVRSIGESGYASPYENNTKLLYSLLEQLKKL